MASRNSMKQDLRVIDALKAAAMVNAHAAAELNAPPVRPRTVVMY
jgi:hypothetical protein